MIQLMTLNLNYLHDKHGPWHERRGRIAGILKREKPDVVALQAVESDKNSVSALDQAHDLGKEAGFPYVYFGAAEKTNGRARGSAFLAQWTLHYKRSHRLTHSSQTEDPAERVLLEATFQINRTIFTVYNVHVSWVGEQAAKNLDEILAVAGSPSSGKTLRFLLGDFNQEPNSRLFNSVREAGWQDAWGLLRKDDPGYTFESDHPSIRIDYMWAFGAAGERIEDIKRIGGPEDRFSDHLALMTKVRL